MCVSVSLMQLHRGRIVTLAVTMVNGNDGDIVVVAVAVVLCERCFMNRGCVPMTAIIFRMSSCYFKYYQPTSTN